MSSRLLLLAFAPCIVGFCPTPHAPHRCALGASHQLVIMKKTWSKRETLAEKEGGASDMGADKVGLEGTIPVEFEQNGEILKTVAMVGQPLSEVASQSGQYIKYKCKKGECGTCEVRVDGNWVRTCVTSVPYVPPGESFKVHVRPGMKSSKKSSRFFSARSFLAGFKNNILGMVGFVREGRKSQNAFQERIGNEKKLMEEVARRKAAKAAAAQKQQ